jgi:coenzyme PQQ synthesis protein D (PqqD)
VTHEVIDGEAVIVNLDSGAYYSLEKSGATIWSLIEERCDLPSIAGAVARAYRGDAGAIRDAITELVSQLQAEQLIVLDERGPSSPVRPAATPSAPPADLPSFEAPILHKFTDMQELLALDPIHDVDVGGWPHQKPT